MFSSRAVPSSKSAREQGTGVAPAYGDRTSEAFWRRLSPRSRFGSKQYSLACLNPALSHGRLVAFKSSQDYASTTGCVRLGSCPSATRAHQRGGLSVDKDSKGLIVFEATGNAATRVRCRGPRARDAGCQSRELLYSSCNGSRRKRRALLNFSARLVCASPARPGEMAGQKGEVEWLAETE